MASQRRRVSTPSEQTSDRSLSAAKIGLIGTLVTAVASVVGIWITSDEPPPPPPIDISGTVVQTSPFGSVGKVTTNSSGSEVTVTGWAESGIDDVVVLIGPRPDDEKYWVANASVTNQRWDVVVKTDPHLVPDYTVKAYFNRGIKLASVTMPLNWPPTTPPAPPPYPGDITQCAALYGDLCFTSQYWGPPSVYQPYA